MHKLDINQVYNGDSNLMIKSIESESVDLVIIDPPYKIRKKTDEINSLAKAVKKYNEELQRDNLINEYDKASQPLLGLLKSNPIKPIFIIINPPFCEYTILT
mgnify:CR=1 FL=1